MYTNGAIFYGNTKHIDNMSMMFRGARMIQEASLDFSSCLNATYIFSGDPYGNQSTQAVRINNCNNPVDFEQAFGGTNITHIYGGLYIKRFYNAIYNARNLVYIERIKAGSNMDLASFESGGQTVTRSVGHVEYPIDCDTTSAGHFSLGSHMDYESKRRFIDALKDHGPTLSSRTINLDDTTHALTDADVKIATDKGWTVNTGWPEQ